MTVQFRPLTDAEYDAYLDRMIPKYAKAVAGATGMNAEEALHVAIRETSKVLLFGRHTPGHQLQGILDGQDLTIGMVWYTVRPSHDPPDLYIHDIGIDKPHRGKDVGSLVMRTLESKASRLGAMAISLYVFSSNERALHFYQRLGYKCAQRDRSGWHLMKDL